MENTLENKAKFFGQYFGVHCLRHEELPNISALPVMTPWHAGLETEYLELKPLSSMCDGDFTEVMCLLFAFQPRSSFKRGKLYTDHLNITQTDYLRSKGYALPWMGLSVEKLIKYGWVKLKGEAI